MTALQLEWLHFLLSPRVKGKQIKQLNLETLLDFESLSN